MTRSVEILERLVGFATVSRQPNTALIDYVRAELGAAGVESTIVPGEDGSRVNLYATVGPADRPGVMLSAHTDVVPVEGQQWSRDPFRLWRENGRLYGRGTADMKGFAACALHAALAAAKRDLAVPLHLAFSYDEEIGCIGVQHLIDMLERAPVRPAFCIVGEPTGMAVATGHKGKTAALAVCTGREGHSALAPMALNAIHLGCDFVAAVRALQGELAADGLRDGDYDVPYTTLHVGRIAGGVQINIVPNRCEVLFEIRNLAGDDPGTLLRRLEGEAARIVAAARGIAPEADIAFEITNTYPGLDTPPDADVVAFVKSLTGGNATIKVAYGTEGGLFDQRLAIPTVICGPGSMAQGHKPDEYVSEEQMARCDAMLAALVDRLAAGRLA